MSRPNNGNVAGAEGRRRCHDNVGGESGNLICDCECVFECLLELLADALGEDDHCNGSRVSPSGGSNGNNRRCQCVYECLFELLSDALEEDNNHHHHCPR